MRGAVIVGYEGPVIVGYEGPVIVGFGGPVIVRCEGRGYRTNECSKDASGLITVTVNVMSCILLCCCLKLQRVGIHGWL
jgi:hypothetical protein